MIQINHDNYARYVENSIRKFFKRYRFICLFASLRTRILMRFWQYFQTNNARARYAILNFERNDSRAYALRGNFGTKEYAESVRTIGDIVRFVSFFPLGETFNV